MQIKTEWLFALILALATMPFWAGPVLGMLGVVLMTAVKLAPFILLGVLCWSCFSRGGCCRSRQRSPYSN